MAYGLSDQVNTCEKPHERTSFSSSCWDLWAMLDVYGTGSEAQVQIDLMECHLRHGSGRVGSGRLYPPPLARCSLRASLLKNILGLTLNITSLIAAHSCVHKVFVSRCTAVSIDSPKSVLCFLSTATATALQNKS